MEEVGIALAELGVEDFTLTEVKGFGRQWGRTEIYMGCEYSLEFIPKSKIELIVSDSHLEAVVAAVARGARTGKIGDGKIFISEIAEVVPIHKPRAVAASF